MKTSSRNILLCSLLFVAVGVLLFALYGEGTSDYFWTLFISYICGAAITTYGVSKTDNVSGDSKLIMFSVETVSLIYWIVYGVVVWKTTKLFEAINMLPVYIAIHLLLNVIFVIVVALVVSGSEYVKVQEETLKEQCIAHKELECKINDILCIYNEVEDVNIKNSMEKISESIRYMDPVSTKEVAKQDNAIYTALGQFESMLENKVAFSTEEIIDKAKEIEKLILMRNNRNKITK